MISEAELMIRDDAAPTAFAGPILNGPIPELVGQQRVSHGETLRICEAPPIDYWNPMDADVATKPVDYTIHRFRWDYDANGWRFNA